MSHAETWLLRESLSRQRFRMQCFTRFSQKFCKREGYIESGWKPDTSTIRLWASLRKMVICVLEISAPIKTGQKLSVPLINGASHKLVRNSYPLITFDNDLYIVCVDALLQRPAAFVTTSDWDSFLIADWLWAPSRCFIYTVRFSGCMSIVMKNIEICE